MRWTRLFDYADGLDFPFANPCADATTDAAWLKTRRGLEKNRVWRAGHERKLVWRGICARVRGQRA